MFNRKLVNFDAEVKTKFSGIDRYSQPKYCYEKAIYVVMISFALDFFFWIDGFQFSFTYGAPLRALLLKRRKPGKYKKYLIQCEAQFLE